jgi:fructokinase
MLGSIEAGGTKFLCGVGTGPDDLETIQIPTTTPSATLDACIDFFRPRRPHLAAIGIASFGPVDLNPDSWTYGYITSTPKSGWRNCDIAGAVRKSLGVPVGFDTDVNGAALGEARWGAAQGLSDFIYLTVGTGIGGGAVANGRVVHGLVHPEMGHIRVPHDRSRDPFDGGCPFHGDCLEGLASGPAIEKRWGISARELPATHPGVALEAHYLALGIANWVCTLSPQRVVLGGGVMQQAQLFPLIRAELLELLNGYVQAGEITECVDHYVVPARLRGRAGVVGGLLLAEEPAPGSPT